MFHDKLHYFLEIDKETVATIIDGSKPVIIAVKASKQIVI